MDYKQEWKPFALILAAFVICFYLPIGIPRFDHSLLEAFALVKWYAREHVLLCLIPAFFIAGAISVFVSQASVMRYLGPNANKFVAYGVASVSGSVLAVCSCTVLPLFAGIYRMGAGLGPASAFLYSGPAINVLAIVMTARILGLELGLARALGAIIFSIFVGALMHFFFRKEEAEKAKAAALLPTPEVKRPLWCDVLYFAAMMAVLVFANWAKPESDAGLWHTIWSLKWIMTSMSAVALGVILVVWFGARWWMLAATALAAAIVWMIYPGQPLAPFTIGVIGLSLTSALGQEELQEWFGASWGFTKQILPLLLGGVMVAGFLLGVPGGQGVIPSEWIAKLVGGNSLSANFLASIVGAFMYFATLTEVPILQGLIANGMGKGPALSLLLAGPALSLPSMLVLRGIMGTKKTAVYVCIVVVMATTTGVLFGAIAS